MSTERYHEVIIPEGREEGFSTLVRLALQSGWGLTAIKEREVDPVEPDLEAGRARWDAHVAEVGPAGVVAELEADMQTAEENWLGINGSAVGVDTAQ